MILARSLVFLIAGYSAMVIAGILFLPILAAPPGASRWLARNWSAGNLWLLRWIVGLSYEIQGRENLPAGPAVYAIKHQSAWETLILQTLIPNAAVVAKRPLFFVPIFGWYLMRVGQVPVSRNSGPASLRRMLAAARRVVAEGRSIALFPEGTRVAPGARGRYQTGVAALYGALGVPVVPVALNSGLFWARGKTRKLPGRITIRVLEPIEPGLDRKTFMATLESRIESTTCELVDDAIREFSLPLLSPPPA